MRVAILQSGYIPWKGYFDIIAGVDVFIFHDDLQYTKGDWRNRNKIKTPKGAEWLTIPCGVSEHRLICEVELKDPGWQRRHWSLIQEYYRNAPHFHDYRAYFEELFLGQTWTNLSVLNQTVICDISEKFLGLRTRFEDSRNYALTHAKAERVMELLQKAGATSYLSGPAAKAYLNEDDFTRAGIVLQWMGYSDYPEYSQLFPPFEHAVSIIDMLFNLGPATPSYMLLARATSGGSEQRICR